MPAVLENAIIRSLPQALYQPLNIGHFGLALDGVRAFHVADPALPGPARAPRHPPRARGRHCGELRTFAARDGAARARNARCANAAPTRRRGRCRLAQVRVHAPAHRRGIRRGRDRRHRFRPVRQLKRDAGRRARARHGAARGLLPLPRGGPHAGRRAHRLRFSIGDECACGSCGWIPPSARSTSRYVAQRPVTPRRPRPQRTGRRRPQGPQVGAGFARLRACTPCARSSRAGRGRAAALRRRSARRPSACGSCASSRRSAAEGRAPPTAALDARDRRGRPPGRASREVRPSAPLDENGLLDLLTARRSPALRAGAGRRVRSAQPRRLPAHGRRGRRDRGRRAARSRGGPHAGRPQGGGGRGRNHPVRPGDQPGAGAARPEAGGALDRRARRATASRSSSRPISPGRSRSCMGVRGPGPAAADARELRLRRAAADARARSRASMSRWRPESACTRRSASGRGQVAETQRVR